MKAIEGGEPSFDWAMLVPHVVHPLKVAIVEALLYMEQPLSPSQLAKLFDGTEEGYVSRASYHVGELAKSGAIEQVGTRQVRGATQRFYDFPSSASNGNGAS